jgi:hypothetical protein
MSGWTLYGDHDHSEVSVYFGSGGSFYTVYEPGRSLPVAFVIGACGDHDESRARVIVAAPELLSAAQNALKALECASRQLTEDHKMVLKGKSWGSRDIDALRAAIAKATTAVEPNSVGTPEGVNQND